MPIFRFNKAFRVTRDLKVFLNLHSGVTRGMVPDAAQYEKQAEALRNAPQLVKEHRKSLKRKDRENFQLEVKLLRKNREIFQLKNELRRKEWEAAGEPEPETLPDFVIISTSAPPIS